MLSGDSSSAFHDNPRLASGPEALAALNEASQGLAVLIVTTSGFRKRGVVDELRLHLTGAREVLVYDGITPNPELDLLDDLTEEFWPKQPQLLIALGGGSAMDAAKVLAQTLVQRKRPIGLLNRYFRQSEPWAWLPSLPLITVPTTAGTGAEVTPFATVWDGVLHKKYSFAHASMCPTLAILRPELTVSLPWKETFYSALDTVSHGLETLWNNHNTRTSRAYAMEAVELVIGNLSTVLQQPDNVSAREQLQKASFLAGLAISINRTAIAHSISYPLTSHCAVPHGLACSFSLPAIIELVLAQTEIGGKERELLIRVSDWLLRLPVFAELRRYAQWPRIYALIPEMLSPARADNFVLPMDEEGLRALLQRSEHLAQGSTR